MEFPDVVDGGAERQVFQLQPRHAEPLSDRDAQAFELSEVLAGRLITHLGRERQHLDRLPVRQLQALVRLLYFGQEQRQLEDRR